MALHRLLERTSNPKLGLERITHLLHEVGFDKGSMRVIQVVGTNGKGSTVAFIEAILKESGILTGLFTSPHLCTARERIRINGNIISEDDFVKASKHVLACATRFSDEPSFFECILAMAMWLFANYGVKVAIIEAGLGGRLDATTAVAKDLLGISSIDFDHQNILGNTIEEIAREKIGAARSGQTVVTVMQPARAYRILEEAADSVGFQLKVAHLSNLPLGLYGQHQRANAGLAEYLVSELGLLINPSAVANGLLKVNWPGRFEIIKNKVTMVLDGAHNPAGIEELVKCLKAHDQFAHRSLFLVYGSLLSPNSEKKVEKLLSSGLDVRRVYAHQSKNPRAMPQSELCELLMASGLSPQVVYPFVTMQEVIEEAEAKDASVVVCGSLYTIGEIRSEVMSIEMDPEVPKF